MIAQQSDPLLTVKEAAEYIRINHGTMNNWRVQGKGPKYCKIGGNVLYKKSRLDDFIDQGEVG